MAVANEGQHRAAHPVQGVDHGGWPVKRHACCEAYLAKIGKLYTGYCTDGEKVTCEQCGQVLEHVCDEAEGCSWVLVPAAGARFAKPTGRVKTRQPLARTDALKPKQWGTARRPKKKVEGAADLAHPKPVVPDGTAYSRRPREWGRMLFIRSVLPCAARMVPTADPCRGAIQCMHLGPSAKGQKCHDHECGAGCEHHHGMIDNPAGFYIDLSDDERWAFRWAAIEAAREAWDALTEGQREWWDNEAARQWAARNAA
jgi:hypothetical protein